MGGPLKWRKRSSVGTLVMGVTNTNMGVTNMGVTNAFKHDRVLFRDVEADRTHCGRETQVPRYLQLRRCINRRVPEHEAETGTVAEGSRRGGEASPVTGGRAACAGRIQNNRMIRVAWPHYEIPVVYLLFPTRWLETFTHPPANPNSKPRYYLIRRCVLRTC